MFSTEDSKGVRDVNLPIAPPSDPMAPFSPTAVDEASGLLDVTRYVL